MVSQCAVLEDFGLFLVLANKVACLHIYKCEGVFTVTPSQVLFAYHLEALVPTQPGNTHVSQTPQKINGKDVHFFSVGVVHARTLVIYMKKRGVS